MKVLGSLIVGLVCLAVYTDALRCFNCIGKDCRTGEIDCNNPTFRRKIASGGYGTVTPYCVNVTTPSGTIASSCGTSAVTDGIPLGCSNNAARERVCKCNTNGCNNAGILTYSVLTMFVLLIVAKVAKY